MQKLRSVWITYREVPIFGFNLTGYGSDRTAIAAEIDAAEAMFRTRAGVTFRVDLDLANTAMLPEVVSFINAHPGGPDDPIYRLAIVGISPFQKWWYHLAKKVIWPANAAFFTGHEEAKPWLIGMRP